MPSVPHDDDDDCGAAPGSALLFTVCALGLPLLCGVSLIEAP
jgi:hypothetical protein